MRSSSTRRLAVGLEYDGTRYAGWQLQPGLRTIQDSLQRALSSVADHAVIAVCAGRTDGGVHAARQVAHFDTTADRPLRGWVLGCNSQLPADIALHWAREVEPSFHARHSALARTYRYCFLACPTRPALLRDRVCWLRETLDAGAMHVAAQGLVGEHDFSSFRAVECQSATPMRRIDAISVRADGPLVTLEVTANAFLHHMVRNIAGTLREVGTGARSPGSMAATLADRDRTQAGVTAPAGGLYLWQVSYPEALGIPQGGGFAPWAMIANA
ncbi:MAG: tRNA pseudouridine(38-40) synthase TruA [Gammaproteobacteria bacterium]